MSDIAADALVIIGSTETAEVLDGEELKRTLTGSASTKPEEEILKTDNVDR